MLGIVHRGLALYFMFRHLGQVAKFFTMLPLIRVRIRSCSCLNQPQRNKRHLFLLLMTLLFGVMAVEAQRVRGELHIEVRDVQGPTLPAAAELLSQANQFRSTFAMGVDGRYVVQDLPFGVYRLRLAAEGFAPWSDLLEIRSEVPLHVSVTMVVAPVSTEVQVSDLATLIDPYRTSTLYPIGQQAIDENLAGQPGRELSNLVDELPGWLYEANGVLHPRGSEYDVQYVVDGLPVTENRSSAFAPSLDTDQVDSIRVLTASYPAEYGRKLGGVIEVTTKKNMPAGLHGQFDASGGSFGTISGSAGVSYARAKDRVSISGDGFHSEVFDCHPCPFR